MHSSRHSSQKTIANPIYPKWLVFLQFAFLLIITAAWLVRVNYPSLVEIANQVDTIAWWGFIIMIGHHWGFNYCLKRFALKYQSKS